jgi:acyl carrier protein
LSDLKLTETKTFLIETLRIPDMEPEDLEDDLPLFGDGLELDSIDALSLVVAIKKKYGIEIPDADAGREHFQSVRTLAELLTNGKL